MHNIIVDPSSKSEGNATLLHNIWAQSTGIYIIYYCNSSILFPSKKHSETKWKKQEEIQFAT